MNVDRALTRGSQISQIALVALAIFGYIYTVIPVYQKDLLSEQIAKKEIELSKLEKDLAEYPEKVVALRSQIDELNSDVAQLEQSKERATTELAQIRSKRDQLERALSNVQAKKSLADSRLNQAYRKVYIEALSFSAQIEYAKRDNNIYQIIDENWPKEKLKDYFLTPYDAIMSVINDGGSKSMEALEIIPSEVKDAIHFEIQEKLAEHKYSLSAPLVDLESEFNEFNQMMENAEEDPTPNDGFNEVRFQLKNDFASFVFDAQKREMKRVSEYMDQF